MLFESDGRAEGHKTEGANVAGYGFCRQQFVKIRAFVKQIGLIDKRLNDYP